MDPQTFSQSSHPTFDTNQVTPHLVRVVTLDGSEDEGPLKVIFPHFNVLENDDVKFKVGLQFSNKKQILETIKTFAMMSKKNLKVKKMTRESLQFVNKRVVPSTYGSVSPFKRVIDR